MGTGTFITLGLGISAIIVGLLDLVVGMNFLLQITLWLIFSVAIIAFLFKYFKKQPTVSNTGQSDQGLDTLGSVTRKITQHGRGEVRFDEPVLGNTVWHASANQTLDVGTRVKIEAVNGQLIKVVPVSE